MSMEYCIVRRATGLHLPDRERKHRREHDVALLGRQSERSCPEPGTTVCLHVPRGSSLGHPPPVWRLLRLGSSRLLRVTGVEAASAWRLSTRET